MTQQETFNIGARHLLTQNKLSISDNPLCRNLCAYRGADGTKCAAGIFIPDDQYTQSLEGTPIEEGPKHAINAVSRIIRSCGHDLKLVGRLQAIHDNAPVKDWYTLLADLAVEFDLVLSEYPPWRIASADERKGGVYYE